jgi:acetyl esterase
MPLDPDAQILLDAMIKANRPAFETLTPVQARQQMKEVRALLKQPVPQVAEVRDLAATGPHGDIPVRLYRAKAATPGVAQPALVFFHGGGWVFGDLDTHDNLCRALANSSDGTVLSVDYRLAPEHKFPAAADDSWAAFTWAHANAANLSIDPGRLAIGGDSAGGNLAAVVAMLAQRNGGPRSPAEIIDWRASPMLATNLAGLPPAYIAVAGCDPLHDEGVAFAKLLERNNVPVTLRDFPGQMHGFASMSGFLKAADEVIADIGATLKKRWAA